MKVYARQVNPEYQESPLFIFGIETLYHDSIIMPGNSYFNAHNTSMHAWKKVVDDFDNMTQEWENDGVYYEYNPETGRYMVTYTKKQRTLAEILKDWAFVRPDGKPWTNRQKHAFKILMEDKDHNSKDEEIYLPLLHLLTGYEWEVHTIRGCCQSDWADVITRADVFTPAVLEAFETEYFNTGSEWIIHDEEEAPEAPEDISGYTCYCTAWSDEGIRAELADIAGCKLEEMAMYKWSGACSVDTWEEV